MENSTDRVTKAYEFLNSPYVRRFSITQFMVKVPEFTVQDEAKQFLTHLVKTGVLKSKIVWKCEHCYTNLLPLTLEVGYCVDCEKAMTLDSRFAFVIYINEYGRPFFEVNESY